MPQATHDDFTRAARILKQRSGIILGEHKEDMVARSLGLRTKGCGFAEVREYLNHLEGDSRAAEWEHFVNAFTINHTAFFRENHHFEILGKFVAERAKPLSIWCAAASTGEEPYTIAMTLRENLSNPEVGVHILATDIDTNAIERARAGVYPIDRVQPVKDHLLKKYFQRGKGQYAGMVRVKQSLRNMVEFGLVNLASAENWPVHHKFDAVFCRNTMIYFEKETQEKLLARFAQVMKPGGLLFIGHSESVAHMTTDFRLQGQTVYVREG